MSIYVRLEEQGGAFYLLEWKDLSAGIAVHCWFVLFTCVLLDVKLHYVPHVTKCILVSDVNTESPKKENQLTTTNCCCQHLKCIISMIPIQIQSIF